MTDQKGWVSLHRKLLDNPIFKNPKLLSVFIYCLLKATHKDHEQLVGDQIVSLKPGQLVTGRKAIAAATGLSEQNVRTAKKKLICMGILTSKEFSKYSIISITCWEQYQQANQQVTSSQPATNQQVTTNNNTNNNNNNNNTKERGFIKPTRAELVERFISKGLDRNAADSEAETFYHFYEAKGWMIGKNKMKSWKSAIATWMKRDNRDGKNNRANQPSARKLSEVERVRQANQARRAEIEQEISGASRY